MYKSHEIYFSGKYLPVSMDGPKMTPTGDGSGMIMTYEDKIYSFKCESQTNCYWNTEKTSLEISRERHIMLTIPSSLVENCDCELTSSGDCRCPAGVIGDACDRCKDGYWGLDPDGSLGCKSEFF